MLNEIIQKVIVKLINENETEKSFSADDAMKEIFEKGILPPFEYTVNHFGSPNSNYVDSKHYIHVTVKKFSPKRSYFDDGFLEDLAMKGIVPEAKMFARVLLGSFQKAIARANLGFYVSVVIPPTLAKKQALLEMKHHNFPTTAKTISNSEENSSLDLSDLGFSLISSAKQIENGTSVWFDPMTSYLIYFFQDNSTGLVKRVTAINAFSSSSMQSKIAKDVDKKSARAAAVAYISKKRNNVMDESPIEAGTPLVKIELSCDESNPQENARLISLINGVIKGHDTFTQPVNEFYGGSNEIVFSEIKPIPGRTEWFVVAGDVGTANRIVEIIKDSVLPTFSYSSTNAYVSVVYAYRSKTGAFRTSYKSLQDMRK